MGTLNLKELSILFDESIPIHVVRGLRALRIDGIAHFAEVGMLGVLDLEWIPRLSKTKHLVISNDDAVFRLPDERKALYKSKIGFVSAAGGNKKIWMQGRDLLRHWDKIIASIGEARPFAYRLSAHDFRPVEFKTSFVSLASEAKRAAKQKKPDHP